MKNYLGDVIYACRKRVNLTQDQYGSKYSISGPAVFKFEKGYIKPSLELWLRMAHDADLPERRAVLLWAKRSLPDRFQEYVEVLTSGVQEDAAKTERKREKKSDYSKLATHDEVAKQMANDKSFPVGLREFVMDHELRVLYKPKGNEINQLRDIFGSLGRGNKEMFRAALRVLREFTQAE